MAMHTISLSLPLLGMIPCRALGSGLTGGEGWPTPPPRQGRPQDFRISEVLTFHGGALENIRAFCALIKFAPQVYRSAKIRCISAAKKQHFLHAPAPRCLSTQLQ